MTGHTDCRCGHGRIAHTRRPLWSTEFVPAAPLRCLFTGCGCTNYTEAVAVSGDSLDRAWEVIRQTAPHLEATSWVHTLVERFAKLLDEDDQQSTRALSLQLQRVTQDLAASQNARDQLTADAERTESTLQQTINDANRQIASLERTVTELRNREGGLLAARDWRVTELAEKERNLTQRVLDLEQAQELRAEALRIELRRRVAAEARRDELEAELVRYNEMHETQRQTIIKQREQLAVSNVKAFAQQVIDETIAELEKRKRRL